jgi:alkylation response protein AidB-like acyl-CoA dehydrogenase
VAEGARESEWTQPSFLQEVFLGRFHPELIHPYPEDDPAEIARAQPLMSRLQSLMERVDSDEMDRSGVVPEWVMHELRDMGAFGIKIPTEYGGLGLGQTSYNRALELVNSKDGSLSALLSGHQSIGVPQPLKLFGTEAQKQRYLPRLARGALSAFALTEVTAGSDPANMRTTATPTEDGQSFLLNGEKLWTTNGPRAELMVVMALTPGSARSKGRKQITAFIVETDWPGVEVAHECTFMGLRAISNGVIRFNDVKVPRENILWGEGLGLKLALTTLNTGRLALASSAVGVAKAMLRNAREWGNERVQWGQPIGKHDAIAQKIARMAANTFALEAMSELVSAMADRGGFDIRLEAALTKMYTTEVGWQIVDDTVQIRGGTGYETSASLIARGEKASGVERVMRDFRAYRIFEGSSEITHLAAAREAVDYHFKTAFDVINPEATREKRRDALLRSARFYPQWYTTRWLGRPRLEAFTEFGPLAPHMSYIERTTRKLGRDIFHAMLRLGAQLEQRELVMFRAVDVGTELFAMAAVCSRAHMLRRHGHDNAVELADLFCRESELRIARYFRELLGPNDEPLSRVSREVLGGQFDWLEQGIVPETPAAPADQAAATPPMSAAR